MPHLVLNDSEIGCFECCKWEYKYNRKLKDSMIKKGLLELVQHKHTRGNFFQKLPMMFTSFRSNDKL